MTIHKLPDFAHRLQKVLARYSKTLRLDFVMGCVSAIREILDFEEADGFVVGAKSYHEIASHLDAMTTASAGSVTEGYEKIRDLVRNYAHKLEEASSKNS